MNKIILVVLVIILAAAGVYYYTHQTPAVPSENETAITTATSTTETASSTQSATPESASIGKSVEGRDILAYRYGSGAKKLVFVGGLHGGYEWNTVLAAYQLIDYLKATPSAIPAGVEVTVIPVVNPDGLNKVVGSAGRFSVSDVPALQATQISGRYNANGVDLNRNFDCDWKAKGVWQNKPVDGGASAFSEPESAAMKAFMESENPTAVVVWYSSAGGVYSSSCHNGVLPETTSMTNVYAKASGYPAHEVFNYYEITGDMVNWLAKKNIPAISVLLSNHTDTEWDKNKAGIDAILQKFAQ